MSLAAFRDCIHQASLGENDRKWFPKWLARDAQGKTLANGQLLVTQTLVIDSSKSLLNSGVPAWQRLQGGRVVEAYRELVLQSAERRSRDTQHFEDRKARISQRRGLILDCQITSQCRLARHALCGT